jgi:hypothetical protein
MGTTPAACQQPGRPSVLSLDTFLLTQYWQYSDWETELSGFKVVYKLFNIPKSLSMWQHCDAVAVESEMSLAALDTELQLVPIRPKTSKEYALSSHRHCGFVGRRNNRRGLSGAKATRPFRSIFISYDRVYRRGCCLGKYNTLKDRN